MAPGLRAGDLALVRTGAPVRPGDVVALRRPDRVEHPLLVKRAVARVPGGWHVRGDAPDASTDSRHFGPVPETDVLGRVVLRYWPPRPGRPRLAVAGALALVVAAAAAARRVTSR